MSDRPTLATYICQSQHAYEWKPKTGTHNAPTRSTACTDCETAAALAVEWAEIDWKTLEAAS